MAIGVTDNAAGVWFTTMFDTPVPPLPVPGTLAGGQVPELAAADHFVRGVRIVGRVAGADGLIGIKVRPTGGPLRVTLALRLDPGAVQWWRDKAGPIEGADRPRLTLIRSQGRLRWATLLIQGGPGQQDVRGRVAFVLDPAEVPAEGLLLIEFGDASRLLPTEWAESFAPASPVGLRVDSIEVRPAPEGSPDRCAGPASATHPAAAGLISAGGTVGDPARADPGRPRTDFLVLNPVGGREAEVRCRLAVSLSPRPASGASSQGWFMTSRALPVRALRRGMREWRSIAGHLTSQPVSPDLVTVRAVSLADGRPVPVRLAAAGTDLDVWLPGQDGPVLLHVTGTGAVEPRRMLVCEPVQLAVTPPVPEPA